MAEMRLIDANALLKSFDVAKMVEYDETGCGVTRIAIPVQTIKDSPTIDAVPAVRCRDCIHRGYDACPMCHDEYYYDEDDGADFWTVDNTEDDGFCHMGAKMASDAE